jgi:hypothetical protein
VAGWVSVLVLALVSIPLPHGWSPFSSGEAGSTLRTVALLTAAMIAFVLASLDPARAAMSSPPTEWPEGE